MLEDTLVAGLTSRKWGYIDGGICSVSTDTAGRGRAAMETIALVVGCVIFENVKSIWVDGLSI